MNDSRIRELRWKLLPLFMLLGLLPGLGAISAPLLLGFDDNWVTVNNPIVVHGLPYFFTQLARPFGPVPSSGFEEGHWAPLTFLSFALEHKLFGGPGNDAASFAPAVSRVITLLMHGACGWLVLQIGLRLSLSLRASVFAALLFLFHPTNCESICWIIERNNVLPALFGLMAVYVYVGTDADAGPGLRPERSWSQTLGAGALLLVSQLCKASGVSWWVVLIAFDVLLCHTPKMRRAVARWLLLGLPIALSVFVTLRSHQDQLLAPVGGHAPWTFVASATLLARYLGLLVWPVDLSAFYHVSPIVTLADARLWAGLCGSAAVIFTALKLGISWRRIALYTLWIAAGVAPVISPFVQTSFPLQDRYLYPSLPGFAFFATELFDRAAERLQLSNLFKTSVAGVLLAALLAGAIGRSFIWRSELLIFVDATVKQPDGAMGLSFLARRTFHSLRDIDPNARERGIDMCLDVEERLIHCDDFERVMAPYWHFAEYAQLRLMRGDEVGARALLLQVWNGRPERPLESGTKLAAARFLAYDAFNHKNYLQSLKYAEGGLTHAPGHLELLLDRARALENLGRREEAIQQAQMLTQQPEVSAEANAMLERLKK
jgi:hypothetical protein